MQLTNLNSALIITSIKLKTFSKSLLLIYFLIFCTNVFAQTITNNFTQTALPTNCTALVDFTSGGIANGTSFSVLLSDASGSFAAATTVGTGTTSPITITIPNGQTAGSGYLLKIVCFSPLAESNLSSALQIGNFPVITSTSDFICTSGSVILSTQFIAGANYQWRLSGTNIVGATNNTYTTSTSGNYTVVMTTATNCIKTSSNKSINNYSSPYISFSQSLVCTGYTTNLTAYPSGGTYQWKKDGAIIVGETNQVLTVSTTGSYAVVVTQGACLSSETSSATITFGNKMSFGINYASSIVCAGTITLSPQSSVPAGSTYQWVKDGLDISGSTASTYSATETGFYALKATLGSCSGFSSSYKITIGQITGNISRSGNYNSLCGNGTVVLNAFANGGTTYIYQWIKDGYNISGATSSAYNATVAGIYNVRITSGSCSVITSSFEVSNQLSQPTITNNSNGVTRICTGSINLSVGNYSSTGTTFQWYKDDIAIAGATNISYLADATGNFSVKVTQGTCSATSTSLLISVGSLGSQTIFSSCNGSSFYYYVSSNSYPIGSTFQWYLDSSPISGATSSTITPTIAGTYQVAVTQGTCTEFSGFGSFSTSNTQCSASGSFSAYSSNNGSATTICSGDGVFMYAYSSGASASNSYQWKKDGIDIIGATYDTFVAKETGNFSVAISNGTTTAVSTAITITVGTMPVPTIFGNSTICSGGLANLSTSTAINTLPNTYQWYIDGSPIFGATTSNYVATLSGNFQVYVTRGSCTAPSANFSVLVGTPTVSISPSSGNICSGGLTLTASLSGYDVFYQWMKDGNDIPDAISRTYKANSVGNYSVRITQGTCTVTSSIVTVGTGTVSPSIGYNGSTTICTGGSLRLFSNNNQSYYTYQWAKDNVDIAGATSPSYLATVGGVYKLTLNSFGCTGTSTFTLTVTNSLSTPSITASTFSICSGATTSLNAPTNYSSYQWTKDGQDIVGAVNSVYTTSTSGIYKLKLVQGICSIQSSGSALNNLGLFPTLSYGTAVSDGVGCTTTYSLFANAVYGNGTSYQWQKNGIDIVGATSSSYLPPTSQDGLYTLRVTQNSCSATTNAAKIASGILQYVGIDLLNYPNCGTTSRNLYTASKSGYTYQWVRDGNNISGATSFNYFTNIAGTYQVITTFNGCNSTSDSFVVSTSACPCLPNFYTNSNLAGGPFNRIVTNDVISSETISFSIKTTYDAGKSVVLLPGFNTKSNAIFTAKIGGCSN